MTLKIDKSNWSSAKFGDVVENTNRTIKNPIESGIDKFIGLEHLDGGSLKIKRFGHIADGVTFTKLVSPGQTLFGKRRAYQKKVAFAEINAVCSGDILALAAKPDLVAQEFLPFVVRSEGFFKRALSTSAGSLSPRTRWSDLATFEFLLPPLEQQKEIANTFWALTYLLDTLNEMSSDLIMLKNSVFADFVESVKNPSTATTLGKVADLVIGRTPSKSDKSYWTTSQDFPFCTIADMVENQIFETKLGVTKKSLDEGKAKLVKAGTLMMSFKLTVGRLAYAKVDLCPNEAIVAIEQNSDLIRLDYLELLLAQSEFSKNSNRAVMGFTLNSKSLEKIEIVCPDLEIQRQIMDKIHPIETALIEVSDEIQVVTDLTEELSRVFFGVES